MASVFITGDIHGDPTRLNTEIFHQQKRMRDGQDNNFVIICGDFGLVWDQLYESKNEKYWLNWLENKPFTTLFVSGNHENFDRLYSGESPIEEWHGGLVQKIRPHVLHLLRGEVYEILGKKFFAFGGASSHDIRDGILEPEDTKTIKDWSKRIPRMQFRINHLSWWKQEIASEEEMQYGRDNLAKHNNEVDFIITHCMPQDVCVCMGFYQPDAMTMYFNEIAGTVKFSRWYSGHYHQERAVMGLFVTTYNAITRIV